MTVRSEYGMNDLYSQTKHWAVRKKQAAQIHQLVKTQIRKANRNVKPYKNPVMVTIWYNSRLDIDNHGYLSKLIIDGMKGLLIEDDDRKHLKGLTQLFHSGDKDKIVVEVTEIKEE